MIGNIGRGFNHPHTALTIRYTPSAASRNLNYMEYVYARHFAYRCSQLPRVIDDVCAIDMKECVVWLNAICFPEFG